METLEYRVNTTDIRTGLGNSIENITHTLHTNVKELLKDARLSAGWVCNKKNVAW